MKGLKELRHWAGLIFTSLTLFTLMCSQSGLAEDNSLSLDAAVNEAVTRSPEVAKAREAAEEKRWGRIGAFGAGFLPKVSISASHFFDPKYTQTSVAFGGAPVLFPGFYPNTQAALNVSLPVFNGFANYNFMRAASLMEDAALKDLARAEFSLREEVKLAFYRALAAANLKAVSEQNVKTLEAHLNQITVQRRGGVATNYDSLRVEVQLSEARADRIDAEDNAVLTRKKLTQLLGLETDERPLVGELPIPEKDSVTKLELKDIPAERSDIEALNLRAEAAGKSSSADSVWFVPAVSLEGQYMYYDSQLIDGKVTNTGVYKSAYNIGVFLKWNLFDGAVSIARDQEAAHRAAQAEKASQLAKLQLPYDFAYWKRRYLSNTDHYLSKKLDTTRSEESVRLATQEAKAGTRTASETLDAELDLFRARAGVVNAQLNAAEARIRLELALGRSL